jgi:AcrR family transcriptional regulator
MTRSGGPRIQTTTRSPSDLKQGAAVRGVPTERGGNRSCGRALVSRKESIIAAALELFAARGYEATSTAELARVAGVSEGTIFHHFKTKDGVLIHILRHMMDRYLGAMERNLPQARSGMGALEDLIRFHFGFIAEYAQESLLIFRDVPSHFLMPDFPGRSLIVAYGSRFLQLIRASIERGKGDGTIRDVPVEQTALIIRGLLAGLTRQKLLGPLEVPDLSEELIDFCIRSLARDA